MLRARVHYTLASRLLRPFASWNLKPNPLVTLDPVPSDVDIAMVSFRHFTLEVNEYHMKYLCDKLSGTYFSYEAISSFTVPHGKGFVTGFHGINIHLIIYVLSVHFPSESTSKTDSRSRRRNWRGRVRTRNVGQTSH